MRKRISKAQQSQIPVSLVVILSSLLVGAPSCDSTTYVLGTWGSESLGGASSGSENLGGSNGGSESVGGASGGSENLGGANGCLALGQSCEEGRECCSSECVGGICAISVPACRAVGSPCAGSLECCSLSCIDGACDAACVPDDAACDGGEQCCSGICSEQKCAALNQACLTAGNPCSEGGDCCSGLCDSGLCSLSSSFCTQEGDICSRSEECCSQTCDLVPGETVGMCASAPRGPSNCSSGIAGSLCDDCNDCCSRLCVPFGEDGLSVCAIAKGCRQTGELCGDDLECCGGNANSSLPGAGNVTCEKRDGNQWGICRNAISCSPQGNVCHIQDYACGVSAAANKCCGSSDADGICRLDSDGVPRCNGLGTTCQSEGDPCGTNEDCCAGLCLPTPAGLLTCQLSGACVLAGDPCTATSECCPGTGCQRQSGGAFGRCSEDGAASCAQEGQICSESEQVCCGGLGCESGRCRGGAL